MSLRMAGQSHDILVLLDAHRSLGRPLCKDDALREAILDEVSRSAVDEQSWTPWRLLSGFVGSDAERRESLRSRAATTTSDVLSGRRRPPQGLERVVDVAARLLLQSELSCSFFGDMDAGKILHSQDSGDAWFLKDSGEWAEVAEELPIDKIVPTWDALTCSSQIPGLTQVCLSNKTVAKSMFIVLTTRSLHLLPLVEGQESNFPRLVWIHCAPQGDPKEFEQVRNFCRLTDGSFLVADDDHTLRAALRFALSLALPNTSKDDDGRKSKRTQQKYSGLLGYIAPFLPLANSETPEQQHHKDCAGALFEVLWDEEILDLEFEPDLAARGRWIVKKSSKSEIICGDVLVLVGQVIAGGDGSAPVATVAVALRDQQRPLRLAFVRNCDCGLGSPNSQHVTQAVLARAMRWGWSKLTPEERQERIRQVVAYEVNLRSLNNEPSGDEDQSPARSTVSMETSFSIDCSRLSVERKMELQWSVALCHVLAFCADAVTLVRAGFVSHMWQDSLQPQNSNLARDLWKWTVRFGDPVPSRCRWAFWQHLRKEHESVPRRVSEYALQLGRGLTLPELADARAVIIADMPRTFAELEKGAKGPALLPEGWQARACPEDYNKRRSSLERVLHALAAECPSVGYCQGLDVITAFALSVAEEGVSSAADVEAETFSFVASLLELGGIGSWFEPPLAGLCASVAVLGGLLRSNIPALAEHLSSEGANVELLSLSWLQTLFCGLAPLPRKTLCRVWECWLLEGSPEVFIRLAFALFFQAKDALLGASLSEISETLRTFPVPLNQGLHQHRLIPEMLALKLNSSDLQNALDGCSRVDDEDGAG